MLNDSYMEMTLTILVIGLMFFVPVSSTIKSVYIILISMTVLSNRRYRQALWQALKLPFVWFGLVFFLLILMSCFWSPASVSFKVLMIDKYSKLLMFPLLVVCFMDKTRRQWGTLAFLSAMLFTGLLALLQKYSLLNLHGTAAIDPGFVFQSHIMTGFMFAFAAYCSAWAFVNKKSSLSRGLYFLLALFFSYEVFFVNTGRTGYFVFLILALLFCIQYFSLKQSIFAVFVCLSTIGLIYSQQNSVMRMNINSLYHSYQNYFKNKKSSSLGYRMQFHEYAAEKAKERPIFGHGTGSFPYYYEKEKPVAHWDEPLLEPHSEYWLIAVQQGAVGLLFLFSYFAALLWYSSDLTASKPLLIGLTVAFMFGCLSDSLLFYGSSGYFFISFAALYYGEFLEKTALRKQVSVAANIGYKV
jgi:O-antigen ligase